MWNKLIGMSGLPKILNLNRIILSCNKLEIEEIFNKLSKFVLLFY